VHQQHVDHDELHEHVGGLIHQFELDEHVHPGYHYYHYHYHYHYHYQHYDHRSS